MPECSAIRRAVVRVCIAAAIAAVLSSAAGANLEPALQCRLGAYTLSDGRSVAIIGFDGTPGDLRYTLSSGEYGHMAWTSGGDYALHAIKDQPYGSVSFSDCGKGSIAFRETGKPDLSGRKVALPATETEFYTKGVRLHGKLVMPADGNAHAIVVWAEGSDDDPSTDDVDWQFILPLQGIGVFVYDKRGTGKSQGEVSADFYVRAADTAAAVKEAQRLAPAVHSFGVFGGSQGGWVAPLTATLVPLDFVIVGYGLAEGVTAQDRDEVEEEVRAAGYGDDVMPKVREITGATTRVVKSEWTSGYEELAAVERKYSGEPWFKVIMAENGYTAIMLKTPIGKIRTMGPKLDRHVSFNYDPQPVIASIRARQLWVLGGADRTAPNAKTIDILRRIQTHRRDLDVTIYKDADHGIVETFEFGGVTRHRYPAGLSDLIARWILSNALPSPDTNLTILRPEH